MKPEISGFALCAGAVFHQRPDQMMTPVPSNPTLRSLLPAAVAARAARGFARASQAARPA